MRPEGRDAEEHKVIPSWRLRVERFARTLQHIGLPDLKMSEVALYLGVIFGVLILWIASTGAWALRKVERGETIYS